MPARKPDTVLISCPHCGHEQAEPRTAFSTNCKACGQYFRLQEILKPAPKVVERALNRKRITCFDCGADLEVAASAESTMCKRCSHHIDLSDYHIANAVSKNFKTKGSFVIELKGYVFNTEITAGDAIIKGRLLGRLVAERSLTIYSTAEIKGRFNTARLIIPAANHFRWKEPIHVGAAEIAGEIAANLHADGMIILKSTARMFGDVEAKDLVIEEGAVVVGNLRIGMKRIS
jgi:cytoskeletal protein CcmA (bactofilin family)/DNA-directed RNA polymerase subunit RPC12/RpoP